MAPDGPGLSFRSHPCQGLLDCRSVSPYVYGGERQGRKLHGPQASGPSPGVATAPFRRS